MSLAHDGHAITCGLCRAPLRAILVSVSGLQLGPGTLTVDDVQHETVECENCGANLGPLEVLKAKYAELWGAT